MDLLHGSVSAGLRINLFFAIRPPTSLRPGLEALAGTLWRAHGLHGWPITGQRLHCTLAPVHAPGRTLEETVLYARRAGAQMADAKPAHTPFAVCFDWTGSFRLAGHERYPLVLRGGAGLCALADFQRSLRLRMAAAGLAVPGSFTPHITLLWADRCVDENPVAPITWMVRDFALVMSLVGRSRHVVLARWRLA